MKIYTDEEVFIISAVSYILSGIDDCDAHYGGEPLPEVLQEIKNICEKTNIRKEKTDFLDAVKKCEDIAELEKLSHACIPSFVRFRIVRRLMALKTIEERKRE